MSINNILNSDNLASLSVPIGSSQACQYERKEMAVTRSIHGSSRPYNLHQPHTVETCSKPASIRLPLIIIKSGQGVCLEQGRPALCYEHAMAQLSEDLSRAKRSREDLETEYEDRVIIEQEGYENIGRDAVNAAIVEYTIEEIIKYENSNRKYDIRGNLSRIS